MSATSRIPARALVMTAVTGASLAAVVAFAPSAASAAPSCTAWGSMPAHVRLAAHPVTVRITLRGTAGCHTDGFDNGATAELTGPGAKDPQRWARFGSQDTQTFALRVNAPGTYTLRDGNVQVYNAGDERVAATWRPTSIVVRRG